MVQSIVKDIDFVSAAPLLNIRGAIYSGVGSPNGIVIGANPGAIYVDQAASQLWFCINAGTAANYSWIPYGSLYNTVIPIATDVQEGHLVGIFGPGVWSLSGNLNVTHVLGAGFGAQNSILVAGGTNDAGSIAITTTELFNGSSWSSTGNLNISRRAHEGTGSLNAGLVTGGQLGGTANSLSSIELFNGSVWTSGANNMTQSRSFHVISGSQSATLANGGIGIVVLTTTELFNGSSWSSGGSAGNLNTAREQHFGGGTQQASLIGGGFNGSFQFNTSELFNGTSWIFSSNMALTRVLAGGSGSQNSALVSGGTITIGGNGISSSELFNGTTWSFSTNLNISRKEHVGSGLQNLGIATGGINGAGNPILSTEIHSQSTYRVLTYRDYPSASNIGIAVNVSNSSLSASLIQGVLPSNIITPYYQQSSLSASVVYNNQFFGLTKFNNDTYQSIASSITNSQVGGMAIVSTGNMQITLSTNNNSLTNIFYQRNVVKCYQYGHRLCIRNLSNH